MPRQNAGPGHCLDFCFNSNSSQDFKKINKKGSYIETKAARVKE